MFFIEGLLNYGVPINRRISGRLDEIMGLLERSDKDLICRPEALEETQDQLDRCKSDRFIEIFQLVIDLRELVREVRDILSVG